MRKDRDYTDQQKQWTTVVGAFEEFEEEAGEDFGTHKEDFQPWFDCFLAGFQAGGCR